MSRQAFYKYDENSKFAQELVKKFALDFAKAVREKDPGMGMVKLWIKYWDEFRPRGVEMLGRDSFVSLLKENNLQVRVRVSKIPKTTDSNHGFHLYPNLVYDVIPTRPNEIWVSDITYIEVEGNNGERYFVYLTLIMDSYTKEVVGWSVGDSLEKEHAIRALEMALSSREIGEDTLIHHSDRGTQYASKAYTQILKDHKIKISMTETGNPHDNAQAERINCTFKREFFKDLTFHSPQEVEEYVRKAVDFYNNERPHMSLDYLTPAEAFNCGGGWQKRWHSFREAAILYPKDEKSKADAAS